MPLCCPQQWGGHSLGSPRAWPWWSLVTINHEFASGGPRVKVGPHVAGWSTHSLEPCVFLVRDAAFRAELTLTPVLPCPPRTVEKHVTFNLTPQNTSHPLTHIVRSVLHAVFSPQKVSEKRTCNQENLRENTFTAPDHIHRETLGDTRRLRGPASSSPCCSRIRPH